MNPNEYKAASLAKDYQDVFNGKSTRQQGLRVMFDLINQCGVFITNSKSPHDAAVLEGKRYVGIHILRYVGMAPQYGGEFSIQNLAQMLQGLETAKQYQDVIDHTATQIKEDESK